MKGIKIGQDSRRMELGTIVFSPSISFSLPFAILNAILIQVRSAEIFCVLFFFFFLMFCDFQVHFQSTHLSVLMGSWY